jgi:AmmeMemoRadiSam system protein A
MMVPTSEAERRELLRLVRSVIAAHVRGQSPPPLPQVGVLGQRAGAFVTLLLNDELRGCIGHAESDLPLATVLGRCAVSASSHDPRFQALTPEELGSVRIELSLLGSIEPVTDVSEIEIGRHGLIVEQRGWQGLLLPQVAIEHEWDRAMFLSQTCVKAGLRPDAWKTGARIFKFEAEVFGEPVP